MGIKEFVEQNGTQFVSEFLIPWLTVPSVSSDASKKDECLKAAHMLEDELKNSSFDVKLVELELGNPLVYAHKVVDPSLPTVLVYGHYDVQPIKQPELWEVEGQKLDGFTPTQIGDRLYARGATDDKGPVSAHLLAMRYFKENDTFPCNIKFIFEGNEEGGGSSFFEWVAQNGELLACDVVLISDTGTMVSGYPALTTSLKGLATTEVRMENIKDLVTLIHTLHDPLKNKSLLPGFYDAVTQQEVDEQLLEEFGDATDAMGSVILPEEGYSQLQHRWYRPTTSPLFIAYSNPNPSDEGTSFKITARGPRTALHSGEFGGPVAEPGLMLAHVLGALTELGVAYDIDYIRYGSRVLSTSIQPKGWAQVTLHGKSLQFAPALRKCGYDTTQFCIESVKDRKSYLQDEKITDGGSENATAYLSFRLVPNQDPKHIYSLIESHVQSHGATCENPHMGSPFSTDVYDPYCQAVVDALQKGYESDGVHLMAAGGSIPITHALSSAVDRPVVLAGLSSPIDNLHAPNESFLLEKGLFVGAQTVCYALENIAQLPKR